MELLVHNEKLFSQDSLTCGLSVGSVGSRMFFGLRKLASHEKSTIYSHSQKLVFVHICISTSGQDCEDTTARHQLLQLPSLHSKIPASHLQ